MVTIDARTQKEIAKKIINKEADYILQVKENQGMLMEDIVLYFEIYIFQRKRKDLENEGRYRKETGFEHGRQEVLCGECDRVA